MDSPVFELLIFGMPRAIGSFAPILHSPVSMFLRTPLVSDDSEKRNRPTSTSLLAV